MRSQNRQGANHRDGRRLGVTASIENGGLLEYFLAKKEINAYSMKDLFNS